MENWDEHVSGLWEHLKKWHIETELYERGRIFICSKGLRDAEKSKERDWRSGEKIGLDEGRMVICDRGLR